MNASPLAGKLVDPAALVNLPRLITAYYTENPDLMLPEQRSLVWHIRASRFTFPKVI